MANNNYSAATVATGTVSCSTAAAAPASARICCACSCRVILRRTCTTAAVAARAVRFSVVSTTAAAT
jgi:hypothetical protein